MARQKSAWALATTSQPYYDNDAEDGTTAKTDHTDSTSGADTYAAVTAANQRHIAVRGNKGSITIQAQQATTAGTVTLKFEGTGDDANKANPKWAKFLELSFTLTTTDVIEEEIFPVDFAGLSYIRLAEVKSSAAPGSNTLSSVNARVNINWDSV